MISKEFIVNTVNNRNEDTTLEFKNYQTKLGFDIFDTVCSFSNRDGGLIIIGVENDTKSIVGVPLEKIDQMQREFANNCSNEELFDSKLSCSLEEVKLDDNVSLLVAEIAPTPYVLRFNNKVFDRNGDADQDITNNKDLIQKIEIRKAKIKTEDELFEHCSISDLRVDLIDRVRKYAVQNNPNHPWKIMSDEELLKSTGLMAKSMSTGKFGIRLAAILLFGKDETISSVCTANKTDCLKRVDDTERYDDRDLITTNLLDTYDRMTSFVKKHLDDHFELDENAIRYSSRDRLFREAIVNSIIHREYLGTNYARMIIEKDKVVFENNCIPMKNGRITLENVEPLSRNPRIAQVFREIGFADELGSGIIKMYKYNNVYCNGEPELLDGNMFKTIIPLLSSKQIKKDFNNKEKLIIDYVKKNGKINNKVCRELLRLEKSAVIDILNKMVEKNIIYRHGNGPATYYDLNSNNL